jgi:predicted GNAT family acetyltransferase
MIRRGGQARVEDDAGSLFGYDAQRDMFSDPAGDKMRPIQEQVAADLRDAIQGSRMSQSQIESAFGVKIAEDTNTVTFSANEGGALIGFKDGGDFYADVTEVPAALQRRGISTRLHDAAIEYAKAKGGSFYSGYELTADGRAFYEGLRRKDYDVVLVDLPNGEQAFRVRRPSANDFLADIGDGKGLRNVSTILDDIDAGDDFADIIALCGKPRGGPA